MTDPILKVYRCTYCETPCVLTVYFETAKPTHCPYDYHHEEIDWQELKED